MACPFFDHCEDIDLRGDGCMNEDENAKRLGLPGICNAVEDTITARDIILALETGVHLHLCHCSTYGDAQMMKIVKEKGYDNIQLKYARTILSFHPMILKQMTRITR